MMNYIKIFSLITIFFLSFFSCKGKPNETSLQEIDFNFKFKTFVEVKENNGEFVIYTPCNGPTRKLKWNSKNELEIIEVVEDLKKEILKSEKFNDGFRIYYGEDEYYDFRIFNKEKEVFKVTCNRKDEFAHKTWGIPPYVIDSKLSDSFKKKKQPCTECYTEEQCIAMGEIPSKPKEIKNYKSNVKVDFKSLELNIDKTQINIELPIPSGYTELPRNIDVYKLNGNSGSFLFVTGERECGECPSFVGTYSEEGRLLSYSYKIKESGERRVISSKGNNSDTFQKYGISGQEINIQMNNPKTPKFEIKN